MEQLRSKWVGLHEIWYLNIFRKSVEEIQLSLKYGMKTNIFFERNVSGKTCRENQNKHFMFKFFFFENRAVYCNVEN